MLSAFGICRECTVDYVKADDLTLLFSGVPVLFERSECFPSLESLLQHLKGTAIYYKEPNAFRTGMKFVTAIINGEKHRGVVTRLNYGGQHEMYSATHKMYIAFKDSEVVNRKANP